MASYPAISFVNNEIATLFNLNSFQTKAVVSDVVQTSSLNVSGPSNTNNLQVASLNVQNDVQLPLNSVLLDTPLITDNSNQIATTSYVQSIANQILGSNNLTINTISMIDQAINNDPNFSSTITSRLTADETNISNLTNRITTDETNTLNALTQINNAITNLQTNQTADETNISNLTNRLNTDETNTSNSLNSINNAITNIQSKQLVDETNISNLTNRLNTDETNTSNSLNSINNAITNIQSKQTTDETNISNLQSSLSGISYNATTGTTINNNLNAKSIIDNGSLICNGGLTVNSGTVSFPINSISPSSINGLLTRLNTDETTISTNTNSINTINTTITNIQSKQTTDENSINTINTNITSIQSKQLVDETNISNIQNSLSGISYNATTGTTINNNLNAKSIIDNGSLICNGGLTVNSGTVSFPINSINSSSINNSNFVDLSNNQTITGQKIINNLQSLTQTQHDNSNKVSTTSYVDTAISNLISGAPSTLSTLNQIASLLQTDTNNIATITNTMVDIGSGQTISGSKTFNSIIIPTDTTPILNSTKYFTSGNLYNTLSNYVLNTSLLSTLSSYQLISDMNNYVLNTSLTNTLSNYLTSSSASSTYQTKLIYDSSPTSASNNSLTSGTVYTALQSVSGSSNLSSNTSPIQISEIFELMTAGNIVSNTLSVNYTGANGLIFATPTANFTLTLTNVPTNNLYGSYTITLLLQVSNYKNYCNAVNVNGNSITMIAGGGVSNLSLNSNAQFALQSLTIIFLNGTIPSRVITNLISIW